MLQERQILKFLQDEGCLIRAIHKSFNLLTISEKDFVNKCLQTGALNEKTLLIHHTEMCKCLSSLTLKAVTYKFAASLDEVQSTYFRLMDENPSNKIHIFKCFVKDNRTHFIEVNHYDQALYDTMYRSVLRNIDSKVSYRVYIERTGS